MKDKEPSNKDIKEIQEIQESIVNGFNSMSLMGTIEESVRIPESDLTLKDSNKWTTHIPVRVGCNPMTFLNNNK